MAGMTLGLDLGPNSIGWALIDESRGRIVATGVRVFPEGVDRDQKGGELSKSEARRVARGMRRQIARRARRKQQLRRALVAAKLLPDIALLERNDPRRSEWEREQFTIANPYTVRRQAVVERLEPYQIGRVLLHLNQRRGFLSNRKTDRAKDKELRGMLAEINDLGAAMQAAAHKTLGEHLAAMQEGKPHVRIRGKHTRRDMFEAEFEAIWSAQGKHHQALLTDALRDRLRTIIFFQRKMYWPKTVVGMCELEPKKRRCRRADLAAQRFRLHQEVNNLKLLDPAIEGERRLTSDERPKLIDYLCTSKERTFDQIRKHLGLFESCKFNLERGDRSKMLGMPTDAMLAHRDIFGSAWYKRSFGERDAIVRVLLNDDLSDDELTKLATEQWGLDEESARRLLGVELPPGYVNFSREAIDKLLPHVERGLLLMTDDGTPSALVAAEYLRPDQRQTHVVDFLPPPPNLPNPIVRQALHEVRRVVNAVIREYGKPGCIHVELAREVKGSLEQRSEMSRRMREREAERRQIAAKIADGGFAPNADAVSRATINRYLLWQEQSGMCMYTGRAISMAQLFSGEVDVDHILPYSRSLDDSLANKAVCFCSANHDKGDRTPYEWMAETDPDAFNQMCQRAAKLPYNKRRKFIQKEVVLDQFIARQLVDTAYITRAVLQYLQCLGADMVSLKGQLTADLRWQWGLDTVLRHDNLQIKNRDDHRHHAVDAIVIALTDRSRLQQLSGIRRRGGMHLTGEAMKEPWQDFRPHVEAAVSSINVSHRAQRRLKGALHEETIYGPTRTQGEYVLRKPLDQLTMSMVDDIRDATIRELVKARLEQFKSKIGGQKIPKEVWKEPLLMKSGMLVRRARLIRRDLTIQPIRNGSAFVKPGKLHHACIFEFKDDAGKTKRDAIYVSLIEAAGRRKRNEDLICRTHPEKADARFIGSIAPGDQMLAEFKGHERLTVVTTLVSTQKRIHLVDANDARPSAEREDEGKKPSTLKGRRVIVDPIGRIRWAND